MQTKKKRKSAWDLDPSRIASAEACLRESRRLLRDPERVLRMLADGRPVKLPLRTDLGVIAALFDAIHRGDYSAAPLQPDLDVLRDLFLFCRAETGLLIDPDAPRFADALLALSAHRRDWIRPLRDWRWPSHNTDRQFRGLVRHLIARYDVPAFLDAAWLDGLTADSVKSQGWYKHIASGRNIRTAPGLPFPLTRMQAHHFLRAPDDFDIPSAFRWAIIVDLGGDERLVRSILATRVGTSLQVDEFWLSVFRFFAANPMLDPSHHGPIVNFLRHQKFEPSVPNPIADRPGQPALIPAQPNLCMKGRTPESVLRAMREWHRSLAQGRAKTVAASWEPSGFPGFECEVGEGEEGRTFRNRRAADVERAVRGRPGDAPLRRVVCRFVFLAADVDLVATKDDRERPGHPAGDDRGQQHAGDHRAGARTTQPAAEQG